MSMYLRVCVFCQERIQEVQISKYHAAIVDEENLNKEACEEEFWGRVEKTTIEIIKIHRQIEEKLPKVGHSIPAVYLFILMLEAQITNIL